MILNANTTSYLSCRSVYCYCVIATLSVQLVVCVISRNVCTLIKIIMISPNMSLCSIYRQYSENRIILFGLNVNRIIIFGFVMY